MDCEFKMNHILYFSLIFLILKHMYWANVDPGTPPDPATAAWTQGDAEAKSTICLLIDVNQRGLIKDFKTVMEVWTALKDHNSKISLLKELCNKNYHEGENMTKHLLDMELLFTKLESAGQKLDENLKVVMVLRSLPDSYDALCTALESRSDNQAKVNRQSKKSEGN